MPDEKNKNEKKLAETLYKANVLPDGNLMGIDPIDAITLKIAQAVVIEDSNKEEEGL